jgi:predicted ester cyclase
MFMASARYRKASCPGEEEGPVSGEENNKALVRGFFEEVWVKGNVAAVDEFMAADYFEHPRPSTLPHGTEGLKQLIAAYRTAFPDLKMTLDDIFAEGDRVAFRWNVSGTHLGDWLGIPSTGNHITATALSARNLDPCTSRTGIKIRLNPYAATSQDADAGEGGGQELMRAVQYSRSGRPDLGVCTSRFYGS